MTSPGWYLRRLSRMGPREVAGRSGDAVRKRLLRYGYGRPADAPALPRRQFTATLDSDAIAAIPEGATTRLVATAQRLLAGRAEYFGVARHDLVVPDWSYDPRTGRRAPESAYAFAIDYRDEAAVGDIKQIWELSRHQHLTVLAAAYACTGDDRYAQRVADHLKSWWSANPPLHGVHWVSGIELGIRLLSWVWVRRLLDGWPGAPGLFEDNPEALQQIWHHQSWLATFPARGSSANNHAVAEAAGQLAAACAFGWFPESPRWRAAAVRSLDEQLRRNTFRSGVNRELATEYHGLVLELGLAAAVEATAAAVPLSGSTWVVLLRMTDALAAMVDARLRPPRQGDGDDGHGLVLDGAGTDRWASLLHTGEVLFGRLSWWPAVPRTDARTPLLAALAAGTAKAAVAGVVRPSARPGHFADAGLTILRAASHEAAPDAGPGGEIWCRCDGGPHGFLAIAAHAHADALSIEVRHDGIDVLADPGTFCYHGDPEWRAYFRSTLGHNTVQIDGGDQSGSGGPFLWTRHARSRVLVAHPRDGGTARWCAEHDGYSRRDAATVHRRSVILDPNLRELRILDEVRGPAARRCVLSFHFGPRVDVELRGSTALLHWDGGYAPHAASLALPATLSWTAHRGERHPPLGWYSPGFGRREPAWTLLGAGAAGGDEAVLQTVLRFAS